MVWGAFQGVLRLGGGAALWRRRPAATLGRELDLPGSLATRAHTSSERFGRNFTLPRPHLLDLSGFTDTPYCTSY